MQPAPSGDAALGLWHGCPWPPQCLGLGWGHSISLGDLELAPCLLHQAVPSARRWHWLWLPDQSSMARRSRARHGTARHSRAQHGLSGQPSKPASPGRRQAGSTHRDASPKNAAAPDGRGSRVLGAAALPSPVGPPWPPAGPAQCCGSPWRPWIDSLPRGQRCRWVTSPSSHTQNHRVHSRCRQQGTAPGDPLQHRSTYLWLQRPFPLHPKPSAGCAQGQCPSLGSPWCSAPGAGARCLALQRASRGQTMTPGREAAQGLSAFSRSPTPKAKGQAGAQTRTQDAFVLLPADARGRHGAAAGSGYCFQHSQTRKALGGEGGGGEGGAMNQSGVPSPASSSWLGRLLPITQPGSVYSRSTIPPCLSCWLRAGECTARWGWAFHTPTAKQILQPLKREICCFLALFRAARAHAWLAGRAHAQTTQLPAAPSPRLLDLSPSCSACTQSTARAVSSAVHLSSSDSEEAEHPSPKLDAARLFSPLEEMREQKRSLGWMHSTNKAVPRMLSPCSCNKAPWAAASNRTSLGCCVSAAPQHRDPLTPHPGTGVAEGKGLTLIQSFSGLVL